MASAWNICLNKTLIAGHIASPDERPAPTIEYPDAHLIPGASVTRLDD